ncbi:hypothetical protein [Coleofasciculus sp. FACHB-T130]|uniref:hypothetical protein n=1 Tax=Cyanophyceae TaxID=3028117 RepID=UPI00168527EC|nr:hypothetical protein [Coleofasciculus sp. FACHB-T130]MBD1878357.1 hypothetical protein [Coleofasciculus sp. FACHB-T130]
MGDIIRAVQAEISFGKVSIDAYKLQNHRFEKRFGVTGVSRVFGYSDQWFGTFTKRDSKRLESLRKAGFTGSQIEVRVPRLGNAPGASIAKTISIRDFNKVIAYEALKKKNTKAIILLIALSEAGLERIVSDAFDGVSLDWFAEKIVHYTQWTPEQLEEAFAYNREEVRALYPWADDPVDEDWDADFRLL